jgi:hypothetical protein
MSEERDYLPDETQMSLEFSILFDSPWLQVRQCEGWYTYAHTQCCGVCTALSLQCQRA